MNRKKPSGIKYAHLLKRVRFLVRKVKAVTQKVIMSNTELLPKDLRDSET